MQPNQQWISARAENLGQHAWFPPAFLILAFVPLFEQSRWWDSSGGCCSGAASDRSGTNCKMAQGREKAYERVMPRMHGTHLTSWKSWSRLQHLLMWGRFCSELLFLPTIEHLESLWKKKSESSGWMALTLFCYLQGSLDSCISSNHTFSRGEAKH